MELQGNGNLMPKTLPVTKALDAEESKSCCIGQVPARLPRQDLHLSCPKACLAQGICLSMPAQSMLFHCTYCRKPAGGLAQSSHVLTMGVKALSLTPALQTQRRPVWFVHSLQTSGAAS